MMRLLVVAIAALAAFFVGWLAPPAADPPSTATASLHLQTPTVDRPGAGVGIAALELARLNPPPPPPKPLGPPPPVVKPPPPPPPPDVATVFRAAITAVVDDRMGLALVVAPLPGAPQRRVLHRGDLFSDGWRIASFDRRGASLERAGERRVVAFFTPPALAPSGT